MSQPNTPVLLVIAGPAGSGKSTLCDRLVAEIPEFERVVTTTTRPPRPGEINGVHYHFLTPEQFDAGLAANDFLEWAWVHGQRRYGTLKSSVLEPLVRGQSLVLSVDVQGVESFRRAAQKNPLLARRLTTVFLIVDHERLVARMIGRAQDNAAEIAGRMQTAEHELQEAHKFDFQIESHTRDEDFATLLSILEKARARTAACT
ncbi:MAG: guanylate kinase [Opitutia bacterium]|nr:MAG: guanylate kinase [Opitutae bacterium]PHX70912.1 MAG: guanylate kinase [Opitutae bacterium]